MFLHLLDVVHVRHGVVGLRLLGEAHKAESAAAAGVTVLDDNLDKVSSARAKFRIAKTGRPRVRGNWRGAIRKSRSRTEEGAVVVGSFTHSFFDLAELLKLLAEGAVVGVPGKAAGSVSAGRLDGRDGALTR